MSERSSIQQIINKDLEEWFQSQNENWSETDSRRFTTFPIWISPWTRVNMILFKGRNKQSVQIELTLVRTGRNDFFKRLADFDQDEDNDEIINLIELWTPVPSHALIIKKYPDIGRIPLRFINMIREFRKGSNLFQNEIQNHQYVLTWTMTNENMSPSNILPGYRFLTNTFIHTCNLCNIPIDKSIIQCLKSGGIYHVVEEEEYKLLDKIQRQCFLAMLDARYEFEGTAHVNPKTGDIVPSDENLNSYNIPIINHSGIHYLGQVPVSSESKEEEEESEGTHILEHFWNLNIDQGEDQLQQRMQRYIESGFEHNLASLIDDSNQNQQKEQQKQSIEPGGSVGFIPKLFIFTDEDHFCMYWRKHADGTLVKMVPNHVCLFEYLRNVSHSYETDSSFVWEVTTKNALAIRAIVLTLTGTGRAWRGNSFEDLNDIFNIYQEEQLTSGELLWKTRQNTLLRSIFDLQLYNQPNFVDLFETTVYSRPWAKVNLQYACMSEEDDILFSQITLKLICLTEDENRLPSNVSDRLQFLLSTPAFSRHQKQGGWKQPQRSTSPPGGIPNIDNSMKAENKNGNGIITLPVLSSKIRSRNVQQSASVVQSRPMSPIGSEIIKQWNTFPHTMCQKLLCLPQANWKCTERGVSYVFTSMDKENDPVQVIQFLIDLGIACDFEPDRLVSQRSNFINENDSRKEQEIWLHLLQKMSDGRDLQNRMRSPNFSASSITSEELRERRNLVWSWSDPLTSVNEFKPSRLTMKSTSNKMLQVQMHYNDIDRDLLIFKDSLIPFLNSIASSIVNRNPPGFYRLTRTWTIESSDITLLWKLIIAAL